MLEVTVTDAGVQNQGITAGAVLNFRPNPNRPKDYGSGYDPSSDTTSRVVAVPEFGGATMKINFAEFREINADPEGHGLTGAKNALRWPNYAIISGPTVACPDDATLTQLKFQGEGLAPLNAAPKRLAITGAKLNDNTFARMRNWNLSDRAAIYERYFVGRNVVNLTL